LLPATAASSTNGHRDEEEENTCTRAAEVNAFFTRKLGFTKQKAQD
jgi:hypothetical protein